MTEQEAQHVLVHYKGSLIRAAMSLFPEVNLDAKKFLALPGSFFIIILLCYSSFSALLTYVQQSTCRVYRTEGSC